jgi:hypothetical protein
MKSAILFAIVLLTSFSEAAIAGNGVGKVISLTAYGNAVIFRTQSDTGNPVCDTDTSGRWVIDASTAQGKVMYATLLQAIAAEKAISVWGSNGCPTWWPSAEFPNSVTINP